MIVAAILCTLTVSGAGIYRITSYCTPEELKNVESVEQTLSYLSNNIGNLEFKLITAQNKYNALTDKEKSKVSNVDLLSEAEALVAQKRQEKVEDAIAKIDKIGEVKFDLDTGKRISSAYTAYILVNEDMRDLVTNYADLEKAKTQYEPYEQQLKASQAAFDHGLRWIELGEYDQAITQFRLVLPEDTSNYENAQMKISMLEQKIKEEKEAKLKSLQQAQQNLDAQKITQQSQQNANNNMYTTVASVVKAFQSHYGLKVKNIKEVHCTGNVKGITVKTSADNYVGMLVDDAPSGLGDVVIKECDAETGYTVYLFKNGGGSGAASYVYDITSSMVFDQLHAQANVKIDVATLKNYL